MTAEKKPRKKIGAAGRAQAEIEQAERYEAKAKRCREVAANIIKGERARAAAVLADLPPIEVD